LSGIVPANEPDGVMCPLMLRRHLVIPAWEGSFDVGPGVRA
jgi:hypothetical protein